MELFADIIVDISCKKLDQTFQYRIPETLKSSLEPGNVVEIPFGRGNRMTKGSRQWRRILPVRIPS